MHFMRGKRRRSKAQGDSATASVCAPKSASQLGTAQRTTKQSVIRFRQDQRAGDLKCKHSIGRARFFATRLDQLQEASVLTGIWPRGVTVSILDSESSDRGSNPREAFLRGKLLASLQ